MLRTPGPVGAVWNRTGLYQEIKVYFYNTLRRLYPLPKGRGLTGIAKMFLLLMPLVSPLSFSGIHRTRRASLCLSL